MPVWLVLFTISRPASTLVVAVLSVHSAALSHFRPVAVQCTKESHSVK